MKALLVLCSLVAPAFAMPPGLTPEVEAPPEPPPSVDQPFADRGALFETALAPDAGSVSGAIRLIPQGGLLTAAAGLAPGVEIQADIGRSYQDRTTTYAATGKLAVIRRPRWQLAVLGGYRHIEIDCGDCVLDRAALLGGMIGTACMDSDCHLLGSFGAGMIFPKMGDDVSAAFTAAIQTGGSGTVHMLAEAGMFYGKLTGFAGARLRLGHFAVDAGLAFSADDQHGQGAPMVGLAGRL